MKYIYSANHNVGFGKYLRKQYKTFINSLNDSSARKISTDIVPCFIVGCGHSGTTLTAAKLGNHKDAFLIGRETNSYAPAKGLYASWCITMEWLSFAKYLDKKIMIEKTPVHIHSVKRIWKILPQAKIVVMVRNPLDNCFSLHNRFKDIDYSIERWNISNAKALQLAERRNVKLVAYEELTTNPESVFKDICRFLEVAVSMTKCNT